MAFGCAVGQVITIHVGFVVDKLAPGQLISKYFGLSYQFNSTNTPYTFIHL
jgi:hypothetical protein